MPFFSPDYIYAALNNSIKTLVASEHISMPAGSLEDYVVFFIFDRKAISVAPHKRYLTYNIKIDLDDKIREMIHNTILNVSRKYRLELMTKIDKNTNTE